MTAVPRTSVALYLDLENLPRGIDLGLLLSKLGHDDPGSFHAVKSAYGSVCQISSPTRKRLTEHGIRIFDTPHLTGKKNRADLMISIDAFERLHVNVPPVDRYVFVSSDSDFSVIMDRLRSYGKQVWMVCRKDDQHKKLLLHACDRLLFLEDFLPVPEADRQAVRARQRAVDLLKETLLQLGPSRLPVSFSVVGAKMRSIDPGFTVRGSGFKTLSALIRHVEQQNLLRTGCDAKGSPQIEDVDDSQLGPRLAEPLASPAIPVARAAENERKPVEARKPPAVRLLWPLDDTPPDKVRLSE